MPSGADAGEEPERAAVVIVDGEESMVGDEADFWIMLKARRSARSFNVYFKGQNILVGGRRQT